MKKWNIQIPDLYVAGISLVASLAGLCFAGYAVGVEFRNAPDGSIGIALSGLAVAILSCLGIYSTMLDKLASPDKLGTRLTIGFFVSLIAYIVMGAMLLFGWRA